ncbi:hypothetical protein GGX14DRAFT_586985 [Mycena pura]|uniref:Transmembrane protein n=1 Tax=Mycena pura TaxID=153505 RepID=A0AAD6XZL8_9AGAR|nr:hypothetical protein GGX14DRAFT_586985 [Mycena pura]
MQSKLHFSVFFVLFAFVSAVAAQNNVTTGIPAFTTADGGTAIAEASSEAAPSSEATPSFSVPYADSSTGPSGLRMSTGAIVATAVTATLGTALLLGGLAVVLVLARRRRLRRGRTNAGDIPDACAAAIRAEQRYLALEDELHALRAEIARLAVQPALLYAHEKDAEAMFGAKDKKALKDGPPTYVD